MDRIILKEMTVVFLLGVMVFTFVLIMNKMLRLVELIVNKGVGVGTVLQLFTYFLPYSLVATIPMAVLLGVLVTHTRLASDGEILALKASGVSVLRLTRPAVVFGILGSVLTLLITIWILPSTNRALKTLVFEMTRRHVSVALQEGIFNNLIDGLTLYVEHLDPKTNQMQGIFLVDTRRPSERRVIVARDGRFTFDEQLQVVGLTLNEGTTHLSASEMTGQYRFAKFSSTTLTVDIGRALPEPIQRPLGEQELTLVQLRERAALLRSQGKNYHPPLVEFHKKLAIPMSCLLFAVGAVPLGSRIRRGGRGWSLVISVGCALGYYLLLVAGEGLGDRGKLHEGVAMWLPNLIAALAGVILLLRAELAPATLVEVMRSRRRRALRAAHGT
jgi:lipopolysaccharide export system permease protein